MKKFLLVAAGTFLFLAAKAQWVLQNAGFSNDTLAFYEFSLPDKDTAWAVCYDPRTGLLGGRPTLDFTRTTNGGATWVPGKMGNDRTLRFSNVSAIDGEEAWVAMNKIGPVPGNYAVGAGGSFGTGGGIYHTADGGTTWAHTEPGVLYDDNSVPRFVHFKDRNHGVTVGDPNGGYFEIYITNNRGKKWKRVARENIPEPLANEMGWISGHAVIGDTIWFGTSKGRMYKSVDFGKHWTVHIVDPLQANYVHEVAFLDDGLTGVLHARRANFVFVYSTTDGGLTWTNYFQPANWKNSRMTAVPGTRAFVSTSVHPNPAFTGASVSYDAGRTWTHIDEAAPKAACRFFDATTGYAGSYFVAGPPLRGGIFKSQIVFQETTAASVAMRRQQTEIEAQLRIFPSPAKDFVNILLPPSLAGAVRDIQVIGTDGKLLESRKVSASGVARLEVGHLPAGSYVIRILTGGQSINKVISIVK